MITAKLPGNAPVDWEDWETPLRQFTEATGLVTSAYDVDGVRRIGPKTGSRLASLLAGSTLWADEGPGSALERTLVDACRAAPHAASAQFGGLRVCALPLLLRGEVYGVLVFGWRFADFSSPLECERIAKQIGLPGHLLWNEVRLDAPVSEQRMGTYAALLETLFLATVSHEMRTPLSALSLRIELMLRTMPDLPPKVVSGLESMRVHVRQETGMVDDLIDAARTLTGQMSIARTQVNLGQVLRDAISTVETFAHSKNISMRVTPSDYGDRIRLDADGRRLQQVFWNLLFNATKFTPEGGVIRIAISRQGEMVAIDIADSGQGIEPEDLPHVFGAFNLQQQNNATGLGLGLYIARRIVELHEGTLSVSSAGRGKGATFAIRLPLKAG